MLIYLFGLTLFLNCNQKFQDIFRIKYSPYKKYSKKNNI